MIRERMLRDKHLRLRLTFVEYAASNLSDGFWQRPYFGYTPTFNVDSEGIRRSGGSWERRDQVSSLVPQDGDILRRRLRKSYDVRSQVFHQSARLDQAALLSVPGSDNRPLSFAGLRRVLDHLLWLEIEAAVHDAPDLPDFAVIGDPNARARFST